MKVSKEKKWNKIRTYTDRNTTVQKKERQTDEGHKIGGEGGGSMQAGPMKKRQPVCIARILCKNTTGERDMFYSCVCNLAAYWDNHS